MEISAKQPNNYIPASAMEQSLRHHQFEDTLEDLMTELANDQKVNPNHKIVTGLLTDIESICQFLEEAKGVNEQLMGQLNLRLQSLINELKRHCCQKSIKTALNAINILNQKSTSIEAYKQTLTAMLSA